MSTTYYARAAVDGWQALASNYQHDLEVYAEQAARVDEQNAQAQADYEAFLAAWETAHAAWVTAHAAWVVDPGDPPTLEPMEPQPPTEPVPQPPPAAPPQPTPPATTYAQRPAVGVEELETPFGPALVSPPSLIVTSSDGDTVAMSEGDFGRAYVDATTVTFELAEAPA